MHRAVSTAILALTAFASAGSLNSSVAGEPGEREELVAKRTISPGQSDHPPDAPFTDLTLTPVASGFTAPLYLVCPPDDDRRFVVDQIGTITILEADGTPQAKPFFDLRDRMATLNEGYDERGLLGLAFHPDYAQNGRFFVYYSAPLRREAPQDWNHTSHVSEFRVDTNDPDRADPQSEQVLMKIDQPQMNHNGGRLLFGPDGYLLIGLGDGGNAGDLGPGHPPLGNGQDVTTILGSILRIDVAEHPYAIPDTNPFAGQTLEGASMSENAEYAGNKPRPEIWAWGIRNAWGMTLDRQTGDLYVADVGQYLWEEANLINRPGNFGWNRKEGTHGFDPQDMRQVLPKGPATGAGGQPFIDPVIEYPHPREHVEGVGKCIVGGHIYRGQNIEPLQGQYVFGDWSGKRGTPGGRLIVANPPSDLADQPTRQKTTDPKPTEQNDGQWPLAVAVEHQQVILGFGEDSTGELYVLSSDRKGPGGTTGRVWRVDRKR